MNIKHYDLFAGIGGFSYALDQVFYDYEIKHIFCEWEAFPTAVLKKHWPDSVYYGDIQELIKELECQNQENAQSVEKRETSHHQKPNEGLGEVTVGPVKDCITKTGENETLKKQKKGHENGCKENDKKSSTHTGINVRVAEKTSQNSSHSTTLKTTEQKNEDNLAPNGGMSLSKETSQTIINSCATTVTWPNQSTKYAHTKEKTNYGDIADLVTDTNISRLQEARSELQATRGGGGNIQSSSDTSNPGTETMHGWEKPPSELTILTGGFPCQPFSHAGRRKGTADDRYKWPEMFRVIQNVRPDWVIAENVAGINSMVQYGSETELEEKEYITEQDARIACEESHKKGQGYRTGTGVLGTVVGDLEREGYTVQTFIIPACAVQAPHQRERVWIVANLRSEEPRRIPDSKRKEIRKTRNGDWNQDWREVALATCHDQMDDGLPRRMGDVTVSGAKYRKEALKAYGNAIVPQVAMEIFKAIKYGV